MQIEFVEQRLGLLQIRRIEALREPAVHRLERKERCRSDILLVDRSPAEIKVRPAILRRLSSGCGEYGHDPSSLPNLDPLSRPEQLGSSNSLVVRIESNDRRKPIDAVIIND